MNPEFNSIEKRFSGKVEKTKDAKYFEKIDEKLAEGLSQLYEGKLKELNLPIDVENARIDMEKFSAIYDKERDLAKDKIYLAKKEEQFKEKGPRQEIEIQLEEDGERFEKLTVILLNKCLPPEYIALRTARFDDVANGVDIVILRKIETEEGNNLEIIGAVDDICNDFRAEKALKKYQEVEKKNHNGGAKLKYGLDIEEDGDIIPCSEIKEIPVFCFLSTHHELIKAIENLGDFNEKVNDSEERLASIIISTMWKQADINSKSNLMPKLKEKFKTIATTLESDKRIKPFIKKR